jgi:hypothetical protein
VPSCYEVTRIVIKHVLNLIRTLLATLNMCDNFTLDKILSMYSLVIKFIILVIR